jgi:hypothetical protein
MAKYIEWHLYDEEPIDPVDPLGNITINGDKGILKEQNLFLDTFLEALVEGLKSIETENVSNVDIVDEPDELVFLKYDKGIQIQYGNQNVTIFDIKSFDNQLFHVVINFIRILDEASESMKKKKLNLIKLRKYIAQSPIL